MLDFAVKKNVHPLIEEKSMRDANNVITDMDKGLARYPREYQSSEWHASAVG